MSSVKAFEHAGRRLTYVDEGSGTPIVLVHAFPLHAGMWAPQLRNMPPGWRVLAPDLSGFHRSPRASEAPARHVRDHASDVLALVEAAAGGTPAIIAGLSMGGYIAFECWRQRPALVRGLVLADTRADPDSDEARARRRTLQATAREDGPGAIADAMVPGLLGSTTQTTNPHLATEVRAMIEASTADGIIDALEALRTRPDSRPTLPTIDCPTLVIVGEEDALTPPALARTIADGVRDATLVTIPQAGHLANLEHPVAFSDALARWLSREFGDGSPR
jgi:3-oxoadipate enol-lactonase